MNKNKLILYGILNALGVLVYVVFVVFVINNGQRFFGPANDFVGSIAILLLFVVSATIVGLLVLGRPAYLYFGGFKKEGLVMLFSTLACLLVFTAVILGILAMTK